MKRSRRVKSNGRWAEFDLIAAIVLAVLAMLCFYMQISSSPTNTTQREVALFNALQFLLTTGFAWFSTRAISKREFEQNLKRFAISAYRRVADIDRMISRLQGETREMITTKSTAERNELRIVEAMVSDMGQIVRSSISDWADVIGDELLALEKIKRLEHERETLKGDIAAQQQTTSEQAPTLREIDAQIKSLLASLPPRLQLDASNGRSPTLEKHAALWVRRMHEDYKGLLLNVVLGAQYGSERKETDVLVGEQLHTGKISGEKTNVIDDEGKTVGRLQNPSPLGYSEFIRAFDQCFGPPPIKLEVVEKLGHEIRNNREYGWIRVKVLAKPVLEIEPRSRSHSPAKAQIPPG